MHFNVNNTLQLILLKAVYPSKKKKKNQIQRVKEVFVHQ